MKVVILCGGRGLRFSEATEHKPKPLIEIGGKPILWHIMKIFSYYGYKEFILCLGYKSEMIKKFFLEYELMSNDLTIKLSNKNKPDIHTASVEHEWNITLAETGLNALTGARIKRVEKYIDSDLFMVTYGDAVADVNIKNLVDFHLSHKKIGTVTAVRPPSRFGLLDIGTENEVKQFKEKAAIEGCYVNGGFFVFDRRVFNYVKDDDLCSFEQEPLERLASDGELAAYMHNSYWQCMDTYRDWQLLNEEWEIGNAPWKLW